MIPEVPHTARQASDRVKSRHCRGGRIHRIDWGTLFLSRCPSAAGSRRGRQSLAVGRMERPALFVGDAEEGAATLKEAEVRFLLGRGSCARSGLDLPLPSRRMDTSRLVVDRLQWRG